MKKIALIIILFGCIFAAGCGQDPDEGVEIVMIDGIKHIQNPAEPINGVVVLELEKRLEINPYELDEVGIRHLRSQRDDSGEVILFDPYQTPEAHRFSAEGDYLGSLITLGEGPGEFPSGQGLYAQYVDDRIYVVGRQKLAVFGNSGLFQEEYKIRDSGVMFLDKGSYVCFSRERQGEISLKKILRKTIRDEKIIEEGPVYLEAENVGSIRKPGGGGAFGGPWGVPDIKFTVDRGLQRVYVVLNSTYRITAKDLQGNTLHVIERPFENVMVSLEDKKEMLPFADQEPMKWILDVYPDELVAIKEMTMLPKGYLAVYRITGPQQTTIDVFDPEGRYVYELKMPEGIKPEITGFYGFGFTNIETRDDLSVYIEYRIRNLPKIFSADH
ncbi:MAG: hypothetical protein WBB73_04680 [Candidatus Aminicenantaceae bacterium]